MRDAILAVLLLAASCYGQYMHRTFTVATLPPAGHPGMMAIVVDAANVTSCANGGGSKRLLCVDTGGFWVPFDSGAGSAAWGGITGALSDQTDLQSALDTKSSTSHNHAGTYEPAISSGNTGQYWRGDKSWQTLDKPAVGLGNVDNTADASKPISTAAQTALDGKAASSHGHTESDVTNLTTDLAAKVPTTRTVNGHALSADVSVTAADVGLGNVNNTSDLDKPISTATQTALNGKQASLGFTPENAANKAVANGYASLDSGSLVVQNPANATATPTGSKIPIAGGGGTLAAGWLPLPTASALGGVKSLTCNGTDKLSAIGTDGLPVCSADQGAAAGDNISVNGTAASDADFDDATPAAPAGGANVRWQKDALAPNNVSAYVDFADLAAAQRKKPLLFTDCLNVAGVAGFDPFYGVAVSSGTINAPNAGLVTAHHPGVVRARSSTTANSGYLISSNAAMFLLGGGEVFEAVFNITTLTNGTFRLGFHDATTSSDAVDGAYLEVASTGVGTGKTASNSTRSSTATTYTLSAGTWYRLVVAVNSGATSVAYYLYSDAGTQLWTDSLATNIPTATGRETGAAMIGTNSGTSATDLYHLDWLAVYFTAARTR